MTHALLSKDKAPNGRGGRDKNSFFHMEVLVSRNASRGVGESQQGLLVTSQFPINSMQWGRVIINGQYIQQGPDQSLASGRYSESVH